MREIKEIVIHCAATPNGNDRFTVRDLDRMHREKGWKKIGYHYVIHVDGELHEGRALDEIGAHVEGSNAKSIGICMIGTDMFTAAQWSTLRDLVNNLQLQFHGTTVWGHRDYSPDRNGDGVIDPWEWFKLCPGFDVSEWRMSGMDPEWNMKHLLGVTLA